MTKKTIDDLPIIDFMIGNYRGEINEDNIPHGFGMLSTMFDKYTSATITGTFKDGFLSEGTAYLTNRDPKTNVISTDYQGKFNYNFQFHGEGELIERDTVNERDQRFHGNFINGVRNGPGVLKNFEGEKKTGTWFIDEFIDQAKFGDNDFVFFGEYNESGLPHGKGHQVFSNGTSNVGEWKNGDFSGTTTTYLNGMIMTNAMKNGEGVPGVQISWPNGQAYIGGFVEANFNGQGILILPNGEIKAGNWHEGKLFEEVENELIEQAKKTMLEGYKKRKEMWEIRTP